MISPILSQYLEKCGLAKSKIQYLTKDTSLYHDLNIYGDVAETYIEVLIEVYKVDMSNFIFDKYFPPEFIGDSVFTKILYSFIPFIGAVNRKKLNFQLFTIEMLEDLMVSKKWDFK